MNRMAISRRLKIMAYVFIYYATVLLVGSVFYFFIYARQKEVANRSLFVEAAFVKGVIKNTADLFFIFIPITAILFIFSAVDLIRIRRKLFAQKNTEERDV